MLIESFADCIHCHSKKIDWCAEGKEKSDTFDEEYVAVEANFVGWWSRDYDNLIMWRGLMCCFMSIALLRLWMVTGQSISVPLDIASEMSLIYGNASILESFLACFAPSTSLLEHRATVFAKM